MSKGIKIMRYAKFTKPLTVALPPEVYDVLKEKSDSERISMAELVRDILRETVLPSLQQSEGEQIAKEKDNDNSK
jgi:hypothetical protein